MKHISDNLDFICVIGWTAKSILPVHLGPRQSLHLDSQRHEPLHSHFRSWMSYLLALFFGGTTVLYDAWESRYPEALLCSLQVFPKLHFYRSTTLSSLRLSRQRSYGTLARLVSPHCELELVSSIRSVSRYIWTLKATGSVSGVFDAFYPGLRLSLLSARTHHSDLQFSDFICTFKCTPAGCHGPLGSTLPRKTHLGPYQFHGRKPGLRCFQRDQAEQVPDYIYAEQLQRGPLLKSITFSVRTSAAAHDGRVLNAEPAVSALFAKGRTAVHLKHRGTIHIILQVQMAPALGIL